jgi:hypothetical protein
MIPETCHIGRSYGLKLENRYFRVTLMSIDESVEPHRAHVIIQEHSIDSFMYGATARRRHTKKGEAVPCVDVPLSDLFDLTSKKTTPLPAGK